jgi:formylglycine-generating enzyme required for sulfatase activity
MQRAPTAVLHLAARAALAALTALVACTNPDAAELGPEAASRSPCPCAAGFVCDPATNQCLPQATADAGPGDGGPGIPDAAPLGDADAEHGPGSELGPGADLGPGHDEAPEASSDGDSADPAEPSDPDAGSADETSPDGDGAAADGCTPQIEQCNGKDDDCDGAVDGDISAGAPDCLELGVCAAAKPAAVCVQGAWACNYGGVALFEASTELSCDGQDNDCDGQTDEDFALATGTPMAAACGLGACAGGKVVCAASGKGAVCDGAAKAGPEACNGLDDDCDGQSDEAADLLAPATDCKATGVCASGAASPSCTSGNWTCDYQKVAGFEGAQEQSCDGQDNDCDGQTDEGCDDDGDGWCDAAMIAQGTPAACPQGGGDCSDGGGAAAAAIHPGAFEACDGVDNNCGGGLDEGCAAELCNDWDDDKDGQTDEGCDDDGDGHCDAKMAVYGWPKVCVATVGTGAVAAGDDCNDDPGLGGAAVHPGKAESCAVAGVDDDCDGATDGAGAVGCIGYYADADQDGYGNGKAQCLCKSGDIAGHTATQTGDCNDSPGVGTAIHPGAAEDCATPADDDCSGSANDVGAKGCSSYYLDVDQDSWGAAEAKCLCSADGAGKYTATKGGDCKDDPAAGGASANPGLPEICGNGVDDNCSAGTDEGCPNANGCPPTGSGAPCGNGKGTCAAGLCQHTDARGHKWTLVPAGPFWMGCNPAVDTACAKEPDEHPQHLVELSAYWIGVYEVTADLYKKCVQTTPGACPLPKTYNGIDHSTYGVAGKGHHPVNHVTAIGAEAVCKWLGGDLPTEAQWEKAARGGCEVYPGKDCKTSAAKYPWGNSEPIICQHAVYAGLAGTCDLAAYSFLLLGIGEGSILGASPYGAYDMAGNVEERVKDSYNPTFYATPAASAKDPVGTGGIPGSTVVRGGGMYNQAVNVRTSRRWQKAFVFETWPGSTAGVRCAKPLLPAKELQCDDKDDNGNGQTDEGCDDDGDDYCDAVMALTGASAACPSGGGDCDDSKGAIHPGAALLCDDIDNDCSGATDAGCDDDKDGHCDAKLAVVGTPKVCPATKGYTSAAPGDDCNDDPAQGGMAVHPGAKDTCATPGVDDNCDAKVDGPGAVGCTLLYPDADQDGYGSGSGQCLCKADPLAGFTAALAGDCDESGPSAAAIHPGAAESCATAWDDNCSGGANDVGALGCKPFYADGDGDGFGSGTPSCVCQADPTQQFVTLANGDCNDDPATGKAVFPGQQESCLTAWDDNCDLDTNEVNAKGCKPFYLDVDADGYGTAATQCLCSADWSTWYSAAKPGDCNDSPSGGTAFNPGKPELCNDQDDDCDSATDEGCAP